MVGRLDSRKTHDLRRLADGGEQPPTDGHAIDSQNCKSPRFYVHNRQETSDLQPTLAGECLHLPTSFVIALGLATVICLATASLGALHMLYISMYITQSGRRLFIVYLANTAPVISMLSLVAMYMPRVWFLAHLISFL
ncbi:hypothetical protein Q1695_008537 [Nippostrongylus brasiliensis]|nr:hypothetical protein Q1695_008537 [Nippostrongylus brasiliensis]